GSSPKMLGKAPSLPADEIFFDLEDSVAPSLKDAARDSVAEALSVADVGERRIGVRINGVGTPRWKDDVEAVVGAGARIDLVTVPKVEGPDEVAAVADAVARAEPVAASWVPVGLQVLIESAKGLAAVEAIAAASDRLQALIFGPADMAASLGMPALS